MGHQLIEGHIKTPVSEHSPFYKKWISQNTHGPDVQIAILHGLLDYHLYYTGVGNFLIDKLGDKAEISWMDFQGHGRSNGTRHNIRSFESLLKDLEVFLADYAFCFKGEKRPKRIVMATGLGALAILRLLQVNGHERFTPDGMVLVNPMIHPHFIIPNRSLEFLEKYKNIVRMFRVPMPERLKWLRNTDIVAKQCSDPLVGKSVGMGLCLEIEKNAEYIRKESVFTDIPTLFQLGQDDVLTAAQSTRLFAKAIGKSKAKILEYPGMRHDLFNDIEADKVLEDVYHWLYETFLLHDN